MPKSVPKRNPLEFAGNLHRIFKKESKAKQISSRALFVMNSMVNAAITDLVAITHSMIKHSKKKTITRTMMLEAIKIITYDDVKLEPCISIYNKYAVADRHALESAHAIRQKAYVEAFTVRGETDVPKYGIHLGRATAVLHNMTSYHVSMDAAALLVKFFHIISKDIIDAADMVMAEKEERMDVRHIQAGVSQTLRDDPKYGYMVKLFNGFFLTSKPNLKAGDRAVQDAEEGKLKRKRKSFTKKSSKKPRRRRRSTKAAYDASGFSEEEEESMYESDESEETAYESDDNDLDF